MWGFWHTQRTPRLQGQEGGSGRDSHSRSSSIHETRYVRLPRVEGDGDGDADGSVHQGQTKRPKMPSIFQRRGRRGESASPASYRVPLLRLETIQRDEGLMRLNLADTKIELTPAPRRLENVPLVGSPMGPGPMMAQGTDELIQAWNESFGNERVPLVGSPMGPGPTHDSSGTYQPSGPMMAQGTADSLESFRAARLSGDLATDENEATKLLRDSIKKAIKASDAAGLRAALADLSPEETEQVLTTGIWELDEQKATCSAIFLAAMKCSSSEVFEVLLDNRSHLLRPVGGTPLQVAAMFGSADAIRGMLKMDPGLWRVASDADGVSAFHAAAFRDDDKGPEVLEALVEVAGQEGLEMEDKNGDTPFHHATRKRNEGVVEWILKKKPDLLQMTNEDRRLPSNGQQVSHNNGM
ncbi:unnamed protein product [Vitrella brassicaformis CCMP3155]|uniref:Uncharacterized protein n=1 Tax=Vitrella brassicaformis (strain CCMP3155) TaxID=1169540 RepID=A0A0G4GHG2_VITBC|nr:unnamed protein product [Vitrella brassicaformis CCMP3155]|eukprot:CEM29165.1 unnamed protein product [Vitrella brassicaformis CCMP3155]